MPPAPPLPGEGSLDPHSASGDAAPPSLAGEGSLDRRPGWGSRTPPSLAGKGAGGLGWAEHLLRRILYWTGGHPYLTQRLCQAVAADGRRLTADGGRKSGRDEPPPLPTTDYRLPSPADVDRLCEALFLSPRARQHDDNLLFVRERLLRSEVDTASLLDLYGRVRSGKRVPAEEENPVVDVLRLSGIVRPVELRPLRSSGHHAPTSWVPVRSSAVLRVRNRIYARVFDREWVRANMPDAELRRQQAAFRRGLLRATAAFGLILAVVSSLAMTALRQSHRATQQERLAFVGRRALRRALYSAQVNLAQQAVETADMGHAEELLMHQKPGPGEEDLRGWEWGYLWHLAHQDESVATLEPNQWFISDVAFSPDGRTLAVTTLAHGLTLWDVIPNHGERKPRRGPRPVPEQRGSGSRSTGDGVPAQRVDLGPPRGADSGGQVPGYPPRVAGTHRRSGTHEVGGWVAAPGTQGGGGPSKVMGRLRILLSGPSASGPPPVQSVCFSPDGQSFAAAYRDRDGTVQWRRTDNQQALVVLNAHPGGTNAVRISPDGHWLATFGQDGRVKLWQAEERGMRNEERGPAKSGLSRSSFLVPRSSRWAWRLVRSMPGGEPLVFSPDSRLLFYHHGLVWDLVAGHSAGRLVGPGDVANSAAFSPDGKLLAAGGMDTGTVWLWNVAGYPSKVGGQVVAAFPGGRSSATQVAYCPDGKSVAAGGADGVIHLWRIADRKEVATLRGHRKPITCLAFSPDGRTLASGSTDGTVKLWSTTPKPPDVLQRRPAPALAMAITPNGRWLATADGDHAATVWDLRARRPVAVLRGHTQQVNRVAISPDGRRVATGSLDNTIRLWETATGRQLASFPGFAGAANRAVAFSPDGRVLARAGPDGTIKLWDIAASKEVATLAGHPTWVGSLTFTPDGRRLVSGSGPPEARVRVWDIASRRQLLLLTGFTNWAGPCAISSNARLLAVGSGDYNVRIFELATGRLLAILRGNKGQLGAVGFSPDGRTLMTACDDGMLKFWSTASWTESAAFADPHLWNAAIFSPDGRSLFTAEEDGSIRIWRAAAVAEAEPQLEWAQHAQAAAEAEQAADWAGALPHLDWLIAARPPGAGLLARRANAHLQLRQWAEAAADYWRAARLEPGNPWTWGTLAHVELSRGDLAGYRRACRGCLDHLGQSADAGIENTIGWTCALAPDAVPHPMLPVKLAQQALSGSPGDGNLMNTLAADLYRAGRFEASLHMMQEAIQHKGHGGNEWDWPFLAMAHARLGHTTEARRWLAKTEKAIRPLLAQPTGPSLPGDWANRLELEQMLREAEQTVRTG